MSKPIPDLQKLSFKSLEYIDFLRKLIFLIEDPVGYAINLTIVSLFLLGLCNVVLSLVRLGRERLVIGRARAALRNPDAQCPTQPGEAVAFLRVSRRSLVGRRIARIVRLRAAGLGQRDVLQQLTMERLDGYGALARYIGTILTLFGLLGTVFGLSLAIFKAQEALGAGYDLYALKSLTQALGGTLGGMKTAFAATLVGLVTALPLSFCNHLVRRTQSRVLTQLEDFVVCDFLPALERVEPGANEAARTFANTLTTAASDLNQVREAVTAAATEYKAGSDVLASVIDTLHSAVQSFSNNTTQLVGNQETFTQTIRDTRDAVRRMVDAMTQQVADQSTALRAFSDMALDLHSNTSTLLERLATEDKRGMGVCLPNCAPRRPDQGLWDRELRRPSRVCGNRCVTRTKRAPSDRFA